MHNTSNLCDSSNIYSLKWLTPAIFMLPMFIPYFPQRCNRSTYDLRSLADPLVRFFLVFSFAASPNFRSFTMFLPILLVLSSLFGASLAPPRFSCALVGTFSCILRFSIISDIVVALARWGAIPLPTPAGQ
jgi:hypothetical protein